MLTLSGISEGFALLQRLKSSANRAPETRAALRIVRPTGVRAPVSTGAGRHASAPQPCPLRVLRVCDAQQQPGDVGRMRISGRMADVCAELERLAAREASALHH